MVDRLNKKELESSFDASAEPIIVVLLCLCSGWQWRQKSLRLACFVVMVALHVSRNGKLNDFGLTIKKILIWLMQNLNRQYFSLNSTVLSGFTQSEYDVLYSVDYTVIPNLREGYAFARFLRQSIDSKQYVSRKMFACCLGWCVGFFNMTDDDHHGGRTRG